MSSKITPRLVIHTGYSCNLRCRFCYYRESLEKGTVSDLTTEEVKRRLRTGRRYGKTAVDYSGGESTIRTDILELVQYARGIGYDDVCIITNGQRTSDPDFCQDLIMSGLTDVLFSLHSPKHERHDYLTQVEGSWGKLMGSMYNMKYLGLGFRVNTVVNNLNYKDLDMYFELLKDLEPRAVNLLVFNPAEEAICYREDDVSIDSYNAIAVRIENALKKYDKEFKINVRFLPFCLLKGYEKNVKTMWQKIYEYEEWDPYLFMRFRKGWLHTIGAFLVGAVMFRGFPTHDPYTLMCEMVQSGRIWYNKRHLPECGKCGMHFICPGLPKAYIERFNKTELYPYDGKEVIDRTCFMKS